MTDNILIFQPYLSNRKLSSNTVERQFRFLKYKKDVDVFALFDGEEREYAEFLSKTNSWVTPIILDDLYKNLDCTIKMAQKFFNFKELYVARMYFTPCTEEQKALLKSRKFDVADVRYCRNFIPMLFADLGVPVKHIVYDPLELNYEGIIDNYTMYSSMNNVKNAECHNFAEIGYYDKGKEVAVSDKKYYMTFGATSSSDERTKLLIQIKEGLASAKMSNLFFRYTGFDNLIDNKDYEELTSKSFFTYTIPSYCPEYMSFTRMLLALSQGTIPLLHPDNNLDCLFSYQFLHRADLESFFKKLVYSVEDLAKLLSEDRKQIVQLYKELLKEWHSLAFYKALQSLE